MAHPFSYVIPRPQGEIKKGKPLVMGKHHHASHICGVQRPLPQEIQLKITAPVDKDVAQGSSEGK